MTPQSDQVSRQRAIEAALVELVACKDAEPIAREGEFGSSWGARRMDWRLRFDSAWESARAALALPSETPVGHQIERDGKESGAVGEGTLLAMIDAFYEEHVRWFMRDGRWLVNGGWQACRRNDERDDIEVVAQWNDYPGGGAMEALRDAAAMRSAIAELSTPSARSDIQDPVFISELSAAGEKSGAAGATSVGLDQ